MMNLMKSRLLKKQKEIHEEEMCFQYLIDEDDRFLYETVVEFEEKERVKSLKESVNKFSENAPEDDTDLECPEDEFDEIRRGARGVCITNASGKLKLHTIGKG